MKKSKIEELILEYINGEMDIREIEEFKDTLLKNGYDLEELEKLKETDECLDAFSIPEPSAEMHARFYSMLEENKRHLSSMEEKQDSFFDKMQTIFQSSFVPKLAYSVMLIIIGWGLGQWIQPGQEYSNQLTRVSTEINEIREMMIYNLVNHPSASERIRTVNLTNSFDTIDEKVIDALLNTLNNDPNTNVRMVTVEALSRFTDNPKVRMGLIESITKQDSPLLQISLADAMVSISEKRSIDALRELIEKKDINSAVRIRIEKCIKVLL